MDGLESTNPVGQIVNEPKYTIMNVTTNGDSRLLRRIETTKTAPATINDTISALITTSLA